MILPAPVSDLNPLRSPYVDNVSPPPRKIITVATFQLVLLPFKSHSKQRPGILRWTSQSFTVGRAAFHSTAFYQPSVIFDFCVKMEQVRNVFASLIETGRRYNIDLSGSQFTPQYIKWAFVISATSWNCSTLVLNIHLYYRPQPHVLFTFCWILLLC